MYQPIAELQVLVETTCRILRFINLSLKQHHLSPDVTLHAIRSDYKIIFDEFILFLPSVPVFILQCRSLEVDICDFAA